MPREQRGGSTFDFHEVAMNQRTTAVLLAVIGVGLPRLGWAAAKVVGVAAGTSHTCAVLGDGSVQCWGRNDHGQLGRSGSDRDSPALVPDLPPARNVAAGGEHTCALLEDTSVRCWGSNANGQLGDGNHSGDSAKPVTVGFPPREHSVSTLRGVVSIGAGDTHTCAALANGEVWCWGDNRLGQLGDPSNPNTEVGTPALVSALWFPGSTGHPPAAKELSAAGQFTCVRLADKSAWCFGLDRHGQLGNGATSDGGRPPV
jgi:alpha-tubulin suppressor-like RCC1 family protein